jgi:hypothetical protein
MNRHASIGATISLALTAILAVRIVAIGNTVALVILAPAALGGVVGLRARTSAALVVAALLTFVTAIVSLIGGVGLLYFPSIALFISAAIDRRRARSRREDPTPDAGSPR